MPETEANRHKTRQKYRLRISETLSSRIEANDLDAVAGFSGHRERRPHREAIRTAKHRQHRAVLFFKRLHRDEIDAYIATSDWQGKAGGYAIQGPAAAYIRHIEGSYSNIVGFSLYDVSALLTASG